MILELRKATDGANFVICVCSEKLGSQIVIPLSEALSVRIVRMAAAEGVGVEKLILPVQYVGPPQRRPRQN